MKKTLKTGGLLIVLLCSLAACQEELPTPDTEPSQTSDPHIPNEFEDDNTGDR